MTTENSKVIRSFTRATYSDQELVGKAHQILTAMTGNSYYPSAEPPLTELETKLTDFESALSKMNGSKMATLYKNQAREDLEGNLQNLADYVQKVCLGDETIATSSGFDLQKKRTSVGILPKPTNVGLKMGPKKGSAILNWSTVPNARFYEYEYSLVTENSEPNWIKNTITNSKVQIDSLVSGKQYVFRVAAGASATERLVSDELVSYIL